MQRKKNKTQKKQRRTEIEDDEITIYYDHITGEPITDPAFPVLIKNGTEWSKNNSILIREVSDFIKKHHKYTSTIVSPPYDAATLEKSEELLKRFTGHVEKLLQLEQGMTDYNKRNNRTIPTDLPKAKASC